MNESMVMNRLQAPANLTVEDYTRFIAELDEEVPDEEEVEVTAPGNIVWLPTQELWVDPLYQRPPRGAIVSEISQHFNHAVCGQIAVNVRLDAESVVIDGQNRLWGAVRAGIDLIHAEVWYGLSIRQEAWLYGRRNNWRSAVSALNQHRAEVVARNREALEMSRITSAHGLSLVNRQGHGSIRAVAAVRDIYRDGGEERLETVLAICLGCFAGARHQFNGHVLRALNIFLRTFGDNAVFDLTALKDRLRSVELVDLRHDGLTIAEAEGMDFDQGIARKMYLLYNLNKRTRRLPNLFELSGGGD